jgi:hypothetical protein
VAAPDESGADPLDLAVDRRSGGVPACRDGVERVAGGKRQAVEPHAGMLGGGSPGARERVAVDAAEIVEQQLVRRVMHALDLLTDRYVGVRKDRHERVDELIAGSMCGHHGRECEPGAVGQGPANGLQQVTTIRAGYPGAGADHEWCN